MRGKRIFNTRLETAAEKPLFRESFQKRRCLLPMSHYFEWGWQERNVPSLLGDEAPMTEKRKVRYAIRPAEAGFVYLAGIYRYEPEEKLPSVSVLTCQPDESIAWLHDRMPVILSEKAALSFLLDDRAVQNRAREMVYRAG